LEFFPYFVVGSFKMPKFVPRQRKQRHRRQETTSAPIDTNVAELAPVSKDEKEARRQKLRDELRDQHANVSSKKQKRLDKYIVRWRV
jgi:ATP-dependent RNA helicase DHX37/DHR1